MIQINYLIVCIIFMKSVLIWAMMISWIIFTIAVLLMSPKGWLTLGVWSVGGTNEYGSKKSIEGTFKTVAVIMCIIFVLCVIALPFVK